MSTSVNLNMRTINMLNPLKTNTQDLQKVLLVNNMVNNRNLLVNDTVNHGNVIDRNLDMNTVNILPNTLFTVPLITYGFSSMVNMILTHNLLITIDELNQNNQRTYKTITSLLLMRLLRHHKLASSLLNLVLKRAVLHDRNLMIKNTSKVLNMLLRLLKESNSTLILNDVRRGLITRMKRSSINEKDNMITVTVLSNIRTMLTLGNLTHNSITLLTIMTMTYRNQVRLILNRNHQTSTLTTGAAITSGRTSRHDSRSYGRRNNGRHLLILKYVIIRIKIILILLLKRRILIDNVYNGLDLRTNILLLNNHTNDGILNEHANSRISPLILIAIKAFTTLSGLSTISLILLILLLGRARVDCSLLKGVIHGEVHPARHQTC